MPTFNLDDYFSKRFGMASPTEPSKQEQLVQAKEQKLQELDEFRQKADRYAAIEAGNQDSWVSRLGLDPDGVVGATVNEFAKGYENTSNEVGKIAGFASEQLANLNDATGIIGDSRRSDALRDQASRLKESLRVTGAYHTPHTEGLDEIQDPVRFATDSVVSAGAGVAGAMLNAPGAVVDVVEGLQDKADRLGKSLGLPEWMMKREYVGPTDLIKPLTEGFTVGDQEFMGLNEFGDLVSEGGQALVSEDNKKHFARITSLGNEALDDFVQSGDVDKMADLLSDPAAWVYAFGQAGPSLLAAYFTGIPGMLAMTTGSAAQDINEFSEKNGPVSKEAAMQAIVQTGAINTLLEKFGLDRVLGKAGSTKLGQAIAARALPRVLGGGLAEMSTEGLQTVNENAAKMLNYDPTQKLTEGVMLASMGGQSTGTAVATLREALGVNAAANDKLDNMSPEVKQAYDNAVKNNDVSSLLDTSSKSYNPMKAAQALKEVADQEEATPELRQANLEKASQILQDLKSTRVDDPRFSRLPENIEQSKRQLAQVQQQLEALPADADPAVRANLEDSVEFLTELANEKPFQGAELKQALKAVAELDKQIATTTKIRDRMMADSAAKVSPENLQEAVALANTDVTNASEESVQEARKGSQTVLQMAMTAPNRLSDDDVNSLLANESNALTSTEREFLRAFSKMRQTSNAAKQAGNVLDNILKGEPSSKTSPGYMGIPQHRQAIYKAISSGAKKEADQAVSAFRTFLQDQQKKMALAQQTYADLKPGEQAYIHRPENTTDWQVTMGAISEQDRRTSGSLRIAKRVPRPNGEGVIDSKKLVNEMLPLGPAALEAFDAEVQAAYALKFSTPAPAVTGNPRVSETPGVVQSTPVTEVDKGSEEVEKGKVTQVTSTPPSPSSETDSTPENPVGANPQGSATAIDARVFAGFEDRVGKPGLWVQDGVYELGENEQTISLNAQQKKVIEDTVQLLEMVWDIKLPRVEVSVSKFRAENNDGMYAAIVKSDNDASPRIHLTQELFRGLVKGEGVEYSQALHAFAHEYAHSVESPILLGSVIPLLMQEYEAGNAKAKAFFDVYAMSFPAGDSRDSELLAELAGWQIRNDPEFAKAYPRSIRAFLDNIAQSQAEDVGRGSRQPSNLGESDASPEAEAAPSSENAPINLVGQEAQQPSDTAPEAGEQGTPATDGKLAIVSEQADHGVPYQKSNPLAGKLTQQLNREGGGAPRPLVAVKDFINNLKNLDLQKYLGKAWDGKITQEHRQFVKFFINMARDWSPKIQKILVPAEGAQLDYRYKDLVQFLIQNYDVEGKSVADLEENVKTAIAYSGLTWTAEALTRNLSNTKEDINRILGRDKDADVSPEEQQMFAQGVPQHMLLDTLGRHVVQALGLKMKAETVGKSKVHPTEDLMPKLQTGLGAYVLEMLENTKLVVEEDVSYLDANDQSITAKIFRLNTDKENQNQLSDALQEIKDISKGVLPILSDLMGSELEKPMPTLEPVVYDRESANHSLQKNTDQLIEAANAKNAEKKTVNEGLYRVMSRISSEALYSIAGVTEVSGETHHVDDIKGAKAANDALRREVDSFFEFVNGMFGEVMDFAKTFHLQYEPWSNGRMGIRSAINPQASKVHRELVSSPDWKVEIKSSNRKMMRTFWVRVGDGLGFASDKKLHRIAKRELDKFLKLPEVVEALEALKHIERNAEKEGFMATQAQEAAIIRAVGMGKEKFHSFHALVAVARYEIAKEAAKGKPFTFTTELRADRDGVANGPILSMLLLGGASTVEGLVQLLKKGGFYTAADTLNGKALTQFNEWVASDPTNRDLYQTGAGRIDEVASRMIQDALASDDVGRATTFANLALLGGAFINKAGEVTKEGRDRVKALLNPLFFGSSITKATNNLSDAFLQGYKDKIVKAYKAKDGSHTELVKAFNALLKDGGYKGNLIPEGISARALLNRPISVYEVAAFRKVFKNSVGRAAQEVVETDFASFLHSRDLMTGASQMSFAIYDAAKKVVRDQFIQEEIKQGRLAVDSNGDPIQDLTRPQQEQLDKRLSRLLPMAHSYYSMESGKIDQAVRLPKSGRAPATNPAYVGEAYIKRNGKRVRRMLRPYVNEDTNPGVRILSSLIHSLDSAISHMTQMAGLGADKVRTLLNMHDSVGGSLASDAVDTQTINQMLLQTITTYSPLQQTLDMILRNLEGLQYLTETDSPLSTQIKQAVAKAIVQQVWEQRVRAVPESSANGASDYDVENFFYGMVQDLDAKAYQADQMKLTTLKELAAIGQYAGESGSYMLTDADRAKIDEQIAALEERVGRSEGVLDQMQSLLGKELELAIASFQTPEEAANYASMMEAELDGVVAEHPVARLPRPDQLQLLSFVASINEELAGAAKQVKKALLASNKRTFRDGIKDLAPEVVRNLIAAMDEVRQKIPAHYLQGLLPKGQKGNTHYLPLVAKFEANPEQTLGSLIDTLRTELKTQYKNNPAGKFYLALLEQAYKQAEDSLKIIYVTPSTHPDMILKARDPDVNHMAWYSLSTDGKEAVYIRGTAFQNSRVTALTLLHELVHQNIVATVAAAMNDKNHPAHAYAMELEALRKELAKTYADQYPEALADIQEFITYGMTHPGFQNNVLMKTNVSAPSTNTRTIGTYFKKFLNTLSGLFYKTVPKDIQTKAMSIMMINTAGIMEVADEQKAADLAQINQFMQQAVTAAPSLNTTEVLTALDQGEHSSRFQENLHQVLQTIVEALHGPFGAFKAQIQAALPKDPLDAYAEAVVNGNTEFTQQAIAAGIPLTDQEAYVAEQVYQTVHAAITDGSASTRMVYRELERLYEETRKVLTDPSYFHTEQWLTATPEQIEAAKRLHGFVYEVKRGKDGRLDHLARFAAMGLGNEAVNAALQRPTQVVTPDPANTFLQRLQNLFTRIASYFSDKVTKTYAGQPADEKLTSLVQQLVNTEVKRINSLNNPKEGIMSTLDRALSSGIGQSLQSGLGKLGNSAKLNNSKFAILRAPAITAQVIANERVGALVKTFQQIRDGLTEEKNGIVFGTLNYVYGVPDKLNALIHWAKNVQGVRQSVISYVTENLLNSFSTELSDPQKRAITFSFLRTGAFTIWDRLGPQALETMLGNPARIKAEIQDQEKRIQSLQPKHATFLLNQAEALGHHLIHGGSYLEAGLLRNTHNMARLLGTKDKDSLSQEEMAALKPELDLLVSLYALSNVKLSDRIHARQVLEQENKRDDGGNGIEVTLKYFQHQLEESMNRNFRGDPTLATQYYLPKVLHPRTDVKIATGSEVDALVAQHYTKVADLPADPADPNQEPRALLVQKDGGLTVRTSAALSFLDSHASGTLLGESGDFITGIQASTVARKKRHVVAALQTQRIHAPKHPNNNALVPVFNPSGEIVNQAYHMTTDVMDTHLEADHRFEYLMGRLEGGMIEKEQAPVVNRQVIEFLKALYDDEFVLRPESFREISSTTMNEENRRHYNELPEPTKQAIRDIFGSDQLMVPTELMDAVFGYSEYSILNAFRKEEDARNFFESMVVMVSEWVLEQYGTFRGMTPDEAAHFAKSAGIKLRKAELASQEIIRAIKDTIVIKTIKVALDNVLSNQTVLWIEGVPLKKGLELQTQAYRSALKYQSDQKELHRLNMLINSGAFQGNDLNELVRASSKLEQEIDLNPVKKLIDIGLMPSIVDDVSVVKDPYTYASLIEEKAQPYLDRAPSLLKNPSVKWLGKQVMMTHDTALYKTLNQMTQMGDFTARYALYIHLTTRKVNPLTHEEAVNRSSESFINYDVPLPKSFAYIEAMGLAYFFKYFLGIQRVLARMMKERPASTMTSHLASSFVDGLATVTDSAAIHRIGWNPFRAGILEAPNILTDQAITGSIIGALK